MVSMWITSQALFLTLTVEETTKSARREHNSLDTGWQFILQDLQDVIDDTKHQETSIGWIKSFSFNSKPVERARAHFTENRRSGYPKECIRRCGEGIFKTVV